MVGRELVQVVEGMLRCANKMVRILRWYWGFDGNAQWEYRFTDL
jgi:hypothetical protein